MQSMFLFAPAEHVVADAGPAAHAIQLARDHGARLTVFVVNVDVTTPGREVHPAAAAAVISDAASKAGIDFKVVSEHSHAIGLPDVVAEHARLHDITIMGCSRDGILSERIMLERLLFDSGRPVIVVPREFRVTGSRRIAAIAWDNTAAAARALGDALPLLHETRAVFLTIDGDKQLRTDLNSSEMLEAAARRGLNAELVKADRGSRNIATALQDEAQARGADFLVMGGYGHSTFRRIVLGSATSAILDDLRMPTLLSH